MIWFALMAAIAGGLATTAFHMVRPAYRSLRISMARFLPDLPVSKAPKNIISLIPPVSSLPFWLRVGAAASIVSSILAALFAEAPKESRPVGLRIVLDLSASMALPEQAGGGVTRIEAARSIIRQAETEARAAAGAAPFCSELVAAGATVQPYPRIPAEKLDVLQPLAEGADAGILLSALDSPASGDCVASHVLVVSDRPRPVPMRPAFRGPVIWHQVGEPLPNLAMTKVVPRGGGLNGGKVAFDVYIRAYGQVADTVRLEARRDGQSLDVSLYRDENTENGWRATIPEIRPGRYDIRLLDGGAYSGDDAVSFELARVPEPVFDWQLATMPRPAGLAEANSSTTAVSVIVTSLDRLSGGLPTDRAVVAVYDGWMPRSAKPPGSTGAAGRIGPFLHAHPLLNDIDFDIFEANAPTPPSGIPPDMIAVIRPEASTGSAFIAVRETLPRAALVPAPVVGATGDIEALSLVLFFNALRWAADSAIDPPVLDWRDAAGRRIINANLESDTARTLSPPPDYGPLHLPSSADSGLVAASADEQVPDWVAWLLVAALLLIAIERWKGLIWRKEVRA